MSYSFNVRAVSAAEALVAVNDELDKVVKSQPVHAEDSGEAFATADMFVRKLHEPGEGEEVSVSVSGYLTKDYDSDTLSSVAVSVQAAIVRNQN